jgi:hypothetical protein
VLSGTPCDINIVSRTQLGYVTKKPRTQLNPVMKKSRTQFDPEKDFGTQLGTADLDDYRRAIILDYNLC